MNNMKSPLFTNNQEDIEKINAHEAALEKEVSECCGAEKESYSADMSDGTYYFICSKCKGLFLPRESSGEEIELMQDGVTFDKFVPASTHKTCTLDEDGNCEECGKVASTDTEWSLQFDEIWISEFNPESDESRNIIKSFIASKIAEARELGYVDGQKHAFGVDRKRVEEEGKQSVLSEILAEMGKLKEEIEINSEQGITVEVVKFDSIQSIIRNKMSK